MPVEIKYTSPQQAGEKAPLFANRTSDLDGTCLETTFEGWKFGKDTQYYFYNGTNGVLRLVIWGGLSDKENFGILSEIMLWPGEAFEEKAWNRNFEVRFSDDKVRYAKGNINEWTDAGHRYFYYATAENELKVIKGEMISGAAWSRWRPSELMTEPEAFETRRCVSRPATRPRGQPALRQQGQPSQSRGTRVRTSQHESCRPARA